MPTFSIGIDYLSAHSRAFYERVRFKLTVSLWLAACSLVCLGLCTIAGGRSQSLVNIIEAYGSNVDSKLVDAQHFLQSGLGFASFAYLCAFFIFAGTAIWASPLLCGSDNEKRMVRGPYEIEEVGLMENQVVLKA